MVAYQSLITVSSVLFSPNTGRLESGGAYVSPTAMVRNKLSVTEMCSTLPWQHVCVATALNCPLLTRWGSWGFIQSTLCSLMGWRAHLTPTGLGAYSIKIWSVLMSSDRYEIIISQIFICSPGYTATWYPLWCTLCLCNHGNLKRCKTRTCTMHSYPCVPKNALCIEGLLYKLRLLL